MVENWSERDFQAFFASVTGNPRSYDWQTTLAAEGVCRSRVVRIPTGMGKTQGVLAAWLYHRVIEMDDAWPRRLVWCLPMRTLVEQTCAVAESMVEKLLLDQTGPVPKVVTVMGGEDLREWYLYPELPAILVGTQDMLLSRALNRGYASARARWPVEFGLLSHDALWVMDEVQLMDVGLATSAQLQAYREQDSPRNLRPCHTWWMSATLQPEWLRSVDTTDYHAEWTRNPCTVPVDQRSGRLWDAAKTLTTDAIRHDDAGTFAQRIIAEHTAAPTGEYGRVTLVVCNTVDRACETFDALRSAGYVGELELVHSRFRQAEREAWRHRFLSRSACSRDSDRIIVATQVVEAGVDISAGCLITELAPWPSLVQRFGRCARYGGEGRVIVVDRGRDQSMTAPYATGDLTSAWEALEGLRDVGISTLESFEESIGAKGRAGLYPYTPAHLLLRREYDELFDTTPDLTGADLDISRFIRSGDERDLQVFWLDLEKSESPPSGRRPNRAELCAVPFLRARDWLCGKETKTKRKPILRKGCRAWIWDWIDGEWTEVRRATLLPGRIVCVAAESGGYGIDRGFDPHSGSSVPRVAVPDIPNEIHALDEADNHQDGENLSFNPWKTIACHSLEVADTADEIAHAIRFPPELRDALTLAARWHDVGKSHPAFQGAIRDDSRPSRNDLAKAPENAWLRPPGTYRFPDDSDDRPAFRHELASALGLFAILEQFAPQHPALLGPWLEAFDKLGHQICPPQSVPPRVPDVQRVVDSSAETFNLLVYLVVSHHGKVRVGLHAAPKDQEYRDQDRRGLPIRGIREADRLPGISIAPEEQSLPELSLTLEPAALGLSMRTGASWRERCNVLLERFGPTGLAYLESLFRAADVRASRLMTNDPALI